MPAETAGQGCKAADHRRDGGINERLVYALGSLQKPVGSLFRRGKNILTAARCLEYTNTAFMGAMHEVPPV
jgi:hypothetical protein